MGRRINGDVQVNINFFNRINHLLPNLDGNLRGVKFEEAIVDFNYYQVLEVERICEEVVRESAKIITEYPCDSREHLSYLSLMREAIFLQGIISDAKMSYDMDNDWMEKSYEKDFDEEEFYCDFRITFC